MSDDVSQPCEREHHDATITILSKKKFVYIYIYIFLYTSLVASTLILRVAANAVIRVFFFVMLVLLIISL